MGAARRRAGARRTALAAGEGDDREPAERAPGRAGDRLEHARDDERAERERQLEREAEQEDALRGEAGRERPVVQQPLEVLLQGERDRRKQREEPRGRRRAACAAEHGERAPSQGGAEQRGRDGGEQRYDVQVVAVAGLREVVRALHGSETASRYGEVVAGQQAGGEERRDERPCEAGSRHGRQAPIGTHPRQRTPRPEV